MDIVTLFRFDLGRFRFLFDALLLVAIANPFSNSLTRDWAARYARDSGHTGFIECLLTMAEVEWEHELYFRSQVASHRWGPRLRLWPQPPPKEAIRLSFKQELVSVAERVRPSGKLITDP